MNIRRSDEPIRWLLYTPAGTPPAPSRQSRQWRAKPTARVGPPIPRGGLSKRRRSLTPRRKRVASYVGSSTSKLSSISMQDLIIPAGDARSSEARKARLRLCEGRLAKPCSHLSKRVVTASHRVRWRAFSRYTRTNSRPMSDYMVAICARCSCTASSQSDERWPVVTTARHRLSITSVCAGKAK
jgi:hypothetical protein